MEPIKRFSVILEDGGKRLVGGATGVTYYGALYTDMLWIAPEVRGVGWGKKIMLATEQVGKNRGCLFATVNTMDWEALSFYKNLGYEIEFFRKGYFGDSIMYFLRKSL
jgi:ribosomal protein S18 acetylase RimI-like enzyme